MADEKPPPALFRRMQAASPPPARNGAPWQTGLTLDGEPFYPVGALDRLADVEHPAGATNLDQPAPDTFVLDWTFDIPGDQHTISIPGDGEGQRLLSIPYWGPATEKTVDYYVTHRVEWAEQPADAWVAVSFDGFYPKERDSADILIPLGACDELCPS
ncbi:hypothetical protein C8E87_1042 [Paractinoplanes brasiliensis]|uniref:Uncharacterized protein n=1 Tax=Paractinoplanes brasiliensis TaxID=52695 RepID=A0A4R6JS00_9ACTN|nr:hypothetical protein C8E87_1042 [Actinoplanes brasiliensis]GID29269.1 hypothetical protein Abr02nite_42520 [Actinoplanes brasiliensis]